MRICIVYMGELLHCPPAMSVATALVELGHEVELITFNSEDSSFQDFFMKNKQVKFVDVGKSNVKGLITNKFINLYKIRRTISNHLNSLGKSDIIWVLSSGSVKYIGKQLLTKRYVLHLLELTEELYLIESKHMFSLSRQYAKRAATLVECEYNRAHITKAWWNLSDVPKVLPNKPYGGTRRNKNAEITSRADIAELMNKLDGKKIILYQGNISAERPLKPYIEAVEKMGEEYAFVAMINGADPYKNCDYKNYYYISFVNPPYHLEVTSHAYIGILSYTPIKNSYSILNTLYCAPNKVWEYSQFGIPMIGNDLPALKFMFMEHKNGLCVNSVTETEVGDAIRKIDADYELYSSNSSYFFDSCNYVEVVDKVIKSAVGERDETK